MNQPTSNPLEYKSPHPAPDAHGGAAHGDPLNSYLVVYFTLMGLLILTVCVYFIPFEKIGQGEFSFMNTAIALTIACTKALMVMLVFMHLRHSTKLTWVIAAAGFIWLGIMIVFTFADFQSRTMIPEAMKQPVSDIRMIPLER
jgi:caa(3)-type oxidase subunit IV